MTNRIGLTLLAISTFLTASAQDSPQTVSEERTRAPAASEFLILPLKVYRLNSDDVTEIDCKALTDNDIRRIVAKANIIWSAAGIYWRLDTVEDIKAENTGRIGLVAVANDDEDLQDKAKSKPRLPHALFRRVIPASTREAADVFRVHYVHDFDVNGVYFGNREAMVKETAVLRPVKDGIDEPLPRVTSHELGHALGLPHRQDTFNLMASGTTGTTLNLSEISKAREFATRNPAHSTLASMKEAVEKKPDDPKTAELNRTIKAIETLAEKRVHPVPEFDVEVLTKITEPGSETP